MEAAAEAEEVLGVLGSTSAPHWGSTPPQSCPHTPGSPAADHSPPRGSGNLGEPNRSGSRDRRWPHGLGFPKAVHH